MNYYTNDNQVAVILHDQYGSGWFTQHDMLELLFDYKLAEALDNSDMAAANARLVDLETEYTNAGIYPVRAQDLVVEWVDRGRKFMIQEYDGWETVWYKDQINWIQV